MSRAPRTLVLSLSALALASAPAGAAILAENWHSSLIGGKRAGYVHELRETDIEGGRKVIRTAMETELSIQRMGTEMKIHSRATFVETVAGEALRFESVSRYSSNAYTIKAERQGGLFLVTQESMGKTTETEVAATDDILFPAALEREIKARALKVGAHLELRTFSPDAARPTRMVIDCRGLEEVELDAGRKEKLFRLETTQDVLPGVVLTEWRNGDGTPEKTSLPLLGIELVSLRTTRERALLDPEAVEMLVSTLVDPGAILPRPRLLQRVRYRIGLRQGNVKDLVLPTDSRQKVIGHDDRSFLVEVTRESWEPEKNAPRPLPRYLSATSVLQADDPKVQALAIRAAAPGADPGAAAREINAWVHGAITKKSLSVGLATAAEVARDLTGDCTEHAVLAAALARARGIPAKVAMGLVYVDGKFGYHMWFEVFDAGWHALDPTFGEGAADATHIKLAESALDNGFIDPGIISLVRIISDLSLGIVEYQLDGKTYTPSMPVLGTVSDGVYENRVYNLRLSAPDGWKLKTGTGTPEVDPILRLEGPAGMTGELTVRALPAGFRSVDWVKTSFPGSAVLRRSNIAVSSRPGESRVLERNGQREGLITFIDREQLFALKLGPLGKKEEATLDGFLGALRIQD